MNNCSVFCNHLLVDRASGDMMALTQSYSFNLVWAAAFSSVVWSARAQLMIFVRFRFSVVLFDAPGFSRCHDI